MKNWYVHFHDAVIPLLLSIATTYLITNQIRKFYVIPFILFRDLCNRVMRDLKKLYLEVQLLQVESHTSLTYLDISKSGLLLSVSINSMDIEQIIPFRSRNRGCRRNFATNRFMQKYYHQNLLNNNS